VKTPATIKPSRCAILAAVAVLAIGCATRKPAPPSESKATELGQHIGGLQGGLDSHGDTLNRLRDALK